MSHRIFVAISALFAAGCFFGGSEDTSTSVVIDDKTKDSLPKARPIVPGLYVGDYSWIDSGKAGLESEFLLDTNGAYRLFWISQNEAVYDQRGAWVQRDSSFFFTHTLETWASSGIFNNFTSMENDTNTVRNVTDTTFSRREWTPLRQKPYWIAYHKKSYPKLQEGIYQLTKIYGDSIDTAGRTTYNFEIKLAEGKFTFTVRQDSLPSFQADAKYYQVGSFLATDENRQREVDSTKQYSAWSPIEGSILKRLQTVSDTAFTMWNPPSFFQAGSWDLYSKNATKASSKRSAI